MVNEKEQERVSFGEGSTDAEEDIKKLLTHKKSPPKPVTSKEIETARVLDNEVQESIRLMKQLSLQYDEIEGYIKSIEKSTKEKGDSEPFPIELVSSFIKATRISPSLTKIVTSISEDNKSLRRELNSMRREEENKSSQLQALLAAEKTKKHEARYLDQTIKDLTKELKAQREECIHQRKKILELETSLSAQKKICKQLLNEKSTVQREIDIHEEEKTLLKNIVEEKDAQIDHLNERLEEMGYNTQTLRKETEILKIQNNRLIKRVDLKEKVLTACNKEMEKLIKQLDRLSRTDTQRKEKLEYLKIIKKRLEHENRTLQPPDSKRANKTLEKSIQPEKHYNLEELSEDKREEKTEEKTEEDSTDNISVTHSFSQAVDDASVPDISTSTTEKTTTSFREMQKKTEEMSRKFRELEDLLQDIKKSNDSGMHAVDTQMRKQ